VKKPEIYPWFPAPYDERIVGAIKAVARGDATASQQRLFLDYLIRVVCKTDDLSFRPEDAGGERATCFAEGKRFVGQQIIKLVNISMEVVKRNESGNREQPS